MQWYNTPLDDQVRSPEHAVQFLKQLVQPGDFLVRADATQAPIGQAHHSHWAALGGERCSQLAAGPLSAAVAIPMHAACHSSALLPSPPHCGAQVLKLDIDRTPIELAVMALLQEEAALRGLIGEMFFEEHYIHP